jgi:ubiquinone/menaquinone biosynthesis C-methylase UbiE/uncharacterized protein YbaR (Trm112 family)
MWKRFQRILRCPQCAGSLRLHPFSQHDVPLAGDHVARARDCGLLDADFSTYVEAGVLACDRCEVCYPIFNGLPVLLRYTTKLHDEFERRFHDELRRLQRECRFAHREPAPGERFVQDSFSIEWLAYDFDGVIWEMDYEDHERRFLLELGHFRPHRPGTTFLEVGCGIGITTELAQKNFGADAVGIDLSLAALRATTRNRANPFLHFVQASVFFMPFSAGSFDTIYSRGVLHHTYSTAEAFASMAVFCRRGGATYLWVYGPRSTNDNVLRRGMFVAERIGRKLLRDRADGLLAKLLLPPIAAIYMGFNWSRRLRDRTIQPYNFRRAIHAARDRFTPEFAHRHDHAELRDWFQAAGFVDIEVVDWRVMPSADHDDYRRNTGVRGRKSLGGTAATHIAAPVTEGSASGRA